MNFAACEQPDCLTKIEQINFNPTHGCPSLPKEIFAVRTNATLILQCPGYYGIQVSQCTGLKELSNIGANIELKLGFGACVVVIFIQILSF